MHVIIAYSLGAKGRAPPDYIRVPAGIHAFMKSYVDIAIHSISRCT